jgi:hypothetical protein
MTIPFEKLKARLLANPKVKAEYDALAPEFENHPCDIGSRLGVAQQRLGARQRLAALQSGNGGLAGPHPGSQFVLKARLREHIYHSLVAHCDNGHWQVDALGAPHIGERPEKELSSVSKIRNRPDCSISRSIWSLSRSRLHQASRLIRISLVMT